jgi:zinc D-Ala-D-Ala dipeptidase
MRMRRFRAVLLVCCLIQACSFVLAPVLNAGSLPEAFVYVEEAIPHIRIDLRYFSDNNFLGRCVDGYVGSRCILTREATEALKKVQEELNRFHLGLKIYDAYRPQRAVEDFVRWGKDLDDTRTKRNFYPNVRKEDLFKEGYIAEKSSHSRGSTVDLTIVSMDGETIGRDLDMGTAFDFFGPESWPDCPSMSPNQRGNRLLLRVLMEKHGFEPYPKEWWHFTLKNEPFPDTYFNFPVE